MRIQVGADEAEVPHGNLQLPDTIHAHEGIQTQHAAEAVWILLNRSRYHLEGHVVATRQAHSAGFGCNQKGDINSGLVHPLDHGFESNPS